jgi:hypothetical protein
VKKSMFQFTFLKTKKISPQLLHHIASTTSSITSYSLIQTMYQLPYNSSQEFLTSFGVKDHQHFIEHLMILKSKYWFQEQVVKQSISLFYPLIMLITSTLLFHGFRLQLAPMFKQFDSSVSFQNVFLNMIHIVMICVILIIFISFYWINKALYRKIIFIQTLKHTSFIKALLEWQFMSVVNSSNTSSFSFQNIIELLKAHEHNPLHCVLAYELKEHIEQGEDFQSWIKKISINHHLSHWLEHQIMNHHFNQCELWQQQLQFCIIHHLTRFKTFGLSISYVLIAFNIMGMMSLLTYPYEWMVQL